MADAGWRMTDGGWRMADGRWQMADGGWRMTDGRCEVRSGGCGEGESGEPIVPEPGHIARRQHAQGKDDSRDVAIHQGLVVNLLPAHGLDREDVGAGVPAKLE